MDELNSYKFKIKKTQDPGSTYFHTLLLVDLYHYDLDKIKKDDIFLYIDSIKRCGHIPCVLTCDGNVLWKGDIEFKGVANHYSSMACYLTKLNMQKISFVQVTDENSCKVAINIYLNPAAFSPFLDPGDEVGVNKKPYSGLKENLKCLMQCFHDLKDDCVQYKTFYDFKQKTVEDLHFYVQDFSKVNRRHIDPWILSKYQSDSLLPTLRDYQAEAIHWMVTQEKFEHYNTDDKGIHPLWQQIQTKAGNIFYIQLYSGKLSLQFPHADPFPKGGILADEMGLGKTVEILALHFNHQKPEKYKASEDKRYKFFKKCKKSDESFTRKRPSTSQVSSSSPMKIPKTELLDNSQQIKVAHLEFPVNGHLESDAEVEKQVKGVLQTLLEECSNMQSRKQDTIVNEPLHQSRKPFVSDYHEYKDRNASLLHCTICGELVKGRYIQCCRCVNRMHRPCSGYGEEELFEYHCPSCSSKEIVDSHCTLIVCPDTLQKQWYNEIKMHVKEGSTKFMIYLGVKYHSYIPPKLLAEYDIIITSFSTLRQEFNYVLAENTSRRLRHRKRYSIVPCPLLAINFWRMAIDEAQMVETDNTKLAEMCLRINSVHRWCVTGTPFNRGVQDIYGLLLFLGAKPYNSKLWWYRALVDHHRNGNFLPLFNTIAQLMWRTCKADVIDQIQIPKQTEYITWLQLSAVDRHFYQRQLEKHSKESGADIEKYYPDYESKSIQISNMTKNDVTRFLHPLTQIRQACIHPGVVRNSCVNFEKKCVSMDQILQKLIENSKLECEEAHRKLICSLNGLAGIYILKEDFVQAIDIYQQAITSWKDKIHLKTDSLQKLHTIHNLLDVYNQIKATPLKLDEMQKECQDIKTNYMEFVQKEVTKSCTNFEELKIEVSEVSEQFGQKTSWWMQVLDIGNQTDVEFFQKVRDELKSTVGQSSSSILGRCQSIDGLKMVVIDKLHQIETIRDEIHSSLLELQLPPSKEAVIEAAECCLRPVENSEAPRCMYCVTNDKISSYESTLYSQRVEDFLSETVNTGYRGETQLDVLLKYLRSQAKKFQLTDLLSESKHHLKYMETLKKEFKAIRNVYLSCHGRVQAIDELEMCISRIRLPYPGEEDTEYKLNVVHPLEIDLSRMTFLSDKILAVNELKRKEGQILYLMNLEKAQRNKDGSNPDQCPICVNILGSEWAVFRCGHCVCCDCLVRLEQQHKRLRCPMCRFDLTNESVSLVTLDNNVRRCAEEDKSFDSHISIKGMFSTKIEAIVRRVLWIKQTNPKAKTLLFSTWSNVLSVIGKVLALNGVTYKSLDGKQTKVFERDLHTFKESTDCNVLLLPLHSGAKGLNIIEASHVILTEPTLKLSDELQAVGRVHRIGQTKETFVHRFLVRDTVEEKMHHLLKAKPSHGQFESSNEVGLTVNDLKFLFQPDDHQQQGTD